MATVETLGLFYALVGTIEDMDTLIASIVAVVLSPRSDRMDQNPYESPREAAVKPKRPFNLKKWIVAVIIIWFSLPLIAIGGIFLLGLMGGTFGD